MPGAARKGDIASTGHACTPFIDIATGSNNVEINGIPAARAYIDDLSDHTIRSGNNCVKHIGGSINARVPLSQGSPSVFVNNYPLARRQDAVDAGMIVGGSTNVIVN